MSNLISAIAWHTPIELPTAKLVLLALADNSDDDGKCWPSIQHLATKTGLSKRSVSAQIATLKELKKIDVIPGGTEGKSNTYHLTLGQASVKKLIGNRFPRKKDLMAALGNGGHEPDSLGDAPDSEGGMNDVHGGDAPSAHKPVIEPVSTEPVNNRFVKSPTRFTKPTRPEMELYATKIGLPLSEIEAFFDHHESRGWKYKGGLPVADWQAAMRTWKRNHEKFKHEATTPQHDPNDWRQCL